MRKFISVLLLFALFPYSRLWAEMPKESLQVLSQGEPLAISSEKMTLKGQEDKVLFEGDVLIQRGDIKITAGRVEVLLGDKDQGKESMPKPSSAGEGKEIIQIEMMDKVDLRQGDRRVLANKGVYNTKGGEIVLTGKAEMWEKGYHVQGRRIRLSLTQKKSFVEGSTLTIY
jgi:lipopolysaccharide transport protein LptA